MASGPHKVLMITFKWYLFVSSIFSICCCLVFSIIPYRISYDFRDWLRETLGLDGIAPNYTLELQGICGLNFFLLLPLSIVLLMRRKMVCVTWNICLWFDDFRFLFLGCNSELTTDLNKKLSIYLESFLFI